MILTPPSENGPALSLQPPEAQDDPRLARAVEEYAAALKAGDRPDRQDFLGRYSEIAEALDGYLNGLDFLGAAAVQLDAPSSSGGTRAEGPGLLGELGDFR